MAAKKRVFKRPKPTAAKPTPKVLSKKEKEEKKNVAEEAKTAETLEHVESVKTDDIAVEVGKVEENTSSLVESHQISTLPITPGEDISPKRNKAVFIAIFFAIVLIAGIVFILLQKVATEKKTDSMSSLEKAVVTLEPLPTNTPTPVDVSKLTIKVLNGSGIPGEASRLKGILTAAGFTVSSVGNAETSDYDKTVVQLKPGVDEAVVRVLKAELAKTYSLGGDGILSKNDIYDAVVIIGQEKASP